MTDLAAERYQFVKGDIRDIWDSNGCKYVGARFTGIWWSVKVNGSWFRLNPYFVEYSAQALAAKLRRNANDLERQVIALRARAEKLEREG